MNQQFSQGIACHGMMPLREQTNSLAVSCVYNWRREALYEHNEIF